MMREKHIVGLDLGTHEITAVIAANPPGGHIEVIGTGTAPSSGIRKGVVVNPEAAAEPIRQAVEQAEQKADVVVDSAYVSMSGPRLRGLNNRGIIAITSHDCRINGDDIRRVIDTASVVTLPGGYEIIDVQPQEYIVDGQDGISDPMDMLGTRLEVLAHIITGPMTIRQNIITAVNRAGLLVAGLVLEPIATAEAILLPDEREYGSAAVNIGSETTSLAIYQSGAVQHTAIFPLGGCHFTNDIAFGARTPIVEAERLKREHGCVLKAPLLGEINEPIEVPSMDQRPPRNLSRDILCEILQPRAEEVLNHIRGEIRRTGFDRQLSSGVILTGGGALIQGLPELAEQVLDCPARLGRPTNLSGLSREAASPLCATAIGLVLTAKRNGGSSFYRTHTYAGRLFSRTAARMRDWLNGFF